MSPENFSIQIGDPFTWRPRYVFSLLTSGMDAYAGQMLSCDPDVYLDARKPEWGELDALGVIKYEPAASAPSYRLS